MHLGVLGAPIALQPRGKTFLVHAAPLPELTSMTSSFTRWASSKRTTISSTTKALSTERKISNLQNPCQKTYGICTRPKKSGDNAKWTTHHTVKNVRPFISTYWFCPRFFMAVFKTCTSTDQKIENEAVCRRRTPTKHEAIERLQYNHKPQRSI